jgi:hypothetical protein
MGKWPQVFNLRDPRQVHCAARGCPCPVAGRSLRQEAQSRKRWGSGRRFSTCGIPARCTAPLGAAHAPSPDAHYGHPALRSLGVSSASPSWLAEETNAGSRGTGNPELRALIGLGFQPRCLATARMAPQLATPPARMAGIPTQAATATMAWQPYVGRRPTCLPRLPRPRRRLSSQRRRPGWPAS